MIAPPMTPQNGSNKLTSGYLWCICCERAYHEDDFRTEDGDQLCYYRDCDSYHTTSWKWEHLRADNDFYPEVPEHNTHYRVFPD